MRVLLVQRSLAPPGGGNAVAAWMVHALAGQHDVETLTMSDWSPRETNAFYGTGISGAIVRHVAPLPWRWLDGLPEHQLTRLRWCAVLRRARALADRFDLLVTADNYAALAKPGMQYVHFPADLQPQPARLKPLGRPLSAGHRCRPGLPWNQRDDVFLCIGRFHGSKRIETSISIVKRIRDRYALDARLLIVGSNVDTEYTTRIRGAAAREGNWIEFHEDLSRDQLNSLMGRSRYGIQAMEGEHFGMATAEMTRAGCLVFAHDSGGSREVLNDRELLWTSEDEAAVKFGRVDVEGLRQRLRAHADSFAVERFVDRFKTLVATSIAESRRR